MVYSDLEISDSETDDLVIDGVHARTVEDRRVITQDLRSAIRESGLLVLLIGERSARERAFLEKRVAALAAEDSRIVPGTVRLDPVPGGWLLSGSTYEFGKFSMEVSQ